METESPSLTIKYNPSTLVGPLVWGEALLHLEDDSLDPKLIKQEATLCLYFAVCDGKNVHVFEYALEEIDSHLLVKYARAYEYLRGEPQLYDEPIPNSEAAKYLWIDLPSEDVHYFIAPTIQAWQNRPALVDWTSAEIELIEGTPMTSDRHRPIAATDESSRLRPARRKVSHLLPWSRIAATQSSCKFRITKEKIEREIERHFQSSIPADQQESAPYGSRSTTLRVERKRVGEDQSTGDDGEDEEEGRISLAWIDGDGGEHKWDNVRGEFAD